MATRGEIRAELGIATIEHPDIANKELTTAEAKKKFGRIPFISRQKRKNAHLFYLRFFLL